MVNSPYNRQFRNTIWRLKQTESPIAGLIFGNSSALKECSCNRGLNRRGWLYTDKSFIICPFWAGRKFLFYRCTYRRCIGKVNFENLV